MADDSKVSGFNTISTYRFEEFTDRNLSELERVLISLRSSKDFQNISQFYTKLQEHLKSTSPHSINTSSYTDTFIDQLYAVYRKYGGTSKRENMLLEVEKNIPIATNSDVTAGINDNKAVSAVQFKRMFDEHKNNLNAHVKLRDAILLDHIFTGCATLHLSSIFSTDSNTIDVTDIWNSTEGTLVLKNKIRANGTLFTVNDNSNQLIAVTHQDGIITIDINGNTTDLAIPDGLVKETIVISYNPTNTILANSVNIVTTASSGLLNVTELGLPNGINNNLVGNTLYSLTYYPVSANADEIRFLLN